MKHPKARLLALLFLLLLGAVLLPKLQKDKPTITTPLPVMAEATESSEEMRRTVPETTAAAIPSVTAPLTTAQTTERPQTTAVIEVLAPWDEPPTLITGLPDTPPIALTSETPITESPITERPTLVTGLPDTLPITLDDTPPILAAETVAAYIATAYCLDFPKSEVRSAENLTNELKALVTKAKKEGINTLFFQVRPASDAFYSSEVFPTSRYLVKNEGDPLPLDVLKTLLTLAHAEGIAVHAWVNPYRVTSSGESIASLAPNSPARLHPEYTFTCEGAVYYQPALDEVIALVAEGVGEIVRGYPVDGILFDDYFYPEGIENEDSALYQRYLSKGGKLSLADWRRENVNRLVTRCYETVKAIDPNCLFGIAPRGIWRNITEDAGGSITAGASAYDSIYCDATAWVRASTVDYLAPQLYWSYHEEKAQFINLALWWHTLLENTEIQLIPSLAAYRLSEEEIKAQCFYLASLPHCHGWALYRIAYL